MGEQNLILNWFETAPRRVLALIALCCAAMLAGGLYIQHGLGIEPCPMCIVQRYAVLLVGIAAGVTAAMRSRAAWITGAALVVVFAGFGAFVAARQSWLQWFPPEFSSCGRDFYGMIASFPLQRAIPMIFRGSGDCTKVDWTFLGGSLANWSFIWLAIFIVVAVTLIVKQARRRSDRRAFA